VTVTGPNGNTKTWSRSITPNGSDPDGGGAH